MKAIKSPSNTLVNYQKTELGTHLLNHTTFPQIPDPKDKNMKSPAHSDETTGDNNRRKITKLVKVVSLKWQQMICWTSKNVACGQKHALTLQRCT